MAKKLDTRTQSGITLAMGDDFYPKRYSVEISRGATDETVFISRNCENMTAWELYGVLRMLLLEIERQISIKPDPVEVAKDKAVVTAATLARRKQRANTVKRVQPSPKR